MKPGAFLLIAACDGAWSEPGLVTEQIACDHQGGNDGFRPSGNKCSAFDLCAPGWHICNGAQDVAKHLPEQKTCADGGFQSSTLYATRQRSQGNNMCGDMGANDVFGCSKPGADFPPSSGCAPLNGSIGNGCASLSSNSSNIPIPNWQCGNPQIGHNDTYNELALVTKTGSVGGGGVLCCKD